MKISLPTSRRINWITPKWPLPAQDGARRATVSLLRSLSELGAEIDLFSFVGTDEARRVDPAEGRRELGVRSIQILQKATDGPPSGHLRRVRQLWDWCRSPGEPITLLPYRVSHSAVESAEEVSVVYDGLHGAYSNSRSGLFENRVPTRRIFYRAHNVEASLWEQKASRSPPLVRGFFEDQARKVRLFEESLLRHCTSVATVSPEDLRSFQKNLPQVRGEVIPIGFPLPDPPLLPPAARPDGRCELLFVGRMDWAPNQEGLTWFLRHVWPRLIENRRDLHLNLIGSGESGYLKSFQSLPGLHFLGPVSDLTEWYERSIASVVPIFFGSGVRVKAIEASLLARPCISTRIGVEGTGLLPDEHYFHAESEDDWVRTLTQLNPSQATRRGNAARTHAARHFDPSLAAAKFYEMVCS